MELLLILSAMLSAVTGAFSGAGAPEARAAHAVTAQAATPCPERLVRVAQASRAIPDAGPAIAAIFAAPTLALPASIPLYADRLIE